MIYENCRNREDQDLAQWVLEHMGYEVRQSKQERLSCWDLALRANGKPYALAEFKARSRPYPTIIVDQSKIDGLIRLSTLHNVIPLFIVHWRSIGGYWEWRCHSGCPVDSFKRTNLRGVPGETEEEPDLVYHIPRREFILMKGVDTTDRRV